MIQNNVVMVGLTFSVHFQQFEDVKFLFFCEGACPRTPQKLLQCPTVPIKAGLSRFYLRIPTLLQSRHEYPDFENQLSQANEQRNIFLVLGKKLVPFFASI